MLKINPEERLSITEVVGELQEIATERNLNPKSPITEVTKHPVPFVYNKHTSRVAQQNFCFLN